MRRMYSQEQLIKLIKENAVVEEDLSNVKITKGEYTTDAHVYMTKVGHCTTITGYINIYNTEPDPTEVLAFTCNASLSDIVDGIEIVLSQNNNDVMSFASGYIGVSGENIGVIIRHVPAGISTYFFDFDLIDDNPLPVEA